MIPIREMKNRGNYKKIQYSMFSAVHQGNLETVRKLIDSFGLSYCGAWSDGYVLLCDALKNEQIRVAELLLKSGCGVNSKNKNKTYTALHWAVMAGYAEIVKMILDKGAKIDVKNQYGENPFHFAIEKGHLQIVQHLLNAGASSYCVCRLENRYKPLHTAVEKGRTEIITLLLSTRADVNITAKNDMTPLHIAAKKGYVRIAEDLLNHGAWIHSSTLEEGYTPLHFASELDNEEAIELFLDRGADVNARTKHNSTPLHIAATKVCGRVVELLLQHGAKVDNQDKDGKTILRCAVDGGSSTIVEDVLKYRPDISNLSNRSCLVYTVSRYGEECQKIVKALLEYGFSVDPEDANDPELLHAAAEKGYLKIIEDLLMYGADVNTLHNSSYREGFTPLHSAAKNKQAEVAKLLISYGADVYAQDKIGKTPIFYAVENADSKIAKLLLPSRAVIKGNPELLNIAVEKTCIEIVEALLQHGADINASDAFGRTALHFIVLNEYEGFRGLRTNKDPDMNEKSNIKGEIARLLLCKDAHADAQTKDGVTTLHAAAEKGYAKVVEALLEYNANVNCKDKSDSTPLHHSAREGNEDITIMLLNKGANVNVKQKDGSTPLHIAARKGHKKVSKLLLERGAKVDSKMENNITPLHLVAEEGYQEIIETILQFGADIDSIDAHGRTALHIASQKRHHKVVVILLEYGSDVNITSRSNHTPLDYAMAGISSSYNQSGSYAPNYSSSYSLRRTDTYEVFKRHILKMKTANLYVSQKNLLSMSGSDGMNNFKGKCEKEIGSMKSEKINNLAISFYDILTKDTSSLAIFMRNENVVQVLESYNYKMKFPIYARMIENHFRKGIERNELLEEVNKIFHILCKNLPDLPYDCVEKIISCLSDKELRNLIDACKPLGISNSNINIASNISQVQYIQFEAN